METNTCTKSNKSSLLQDGQLKKIKMEFVNESTCVNSESSYLALSQSQLKGGAANDLLLVLKSSPKEFQLTNSNQSGKNERLQSKEVHSKSIKRNKKNTVIQTEHKVECLELPKADLDDSGSLDVRVKWEVKSFDLNKEQKDDVIIVSSQRDRKGRKTDDLINDNKRFEYMETRLEKIPKDILGKYGLVIEENDVCRNSPASEQSINAWDEDIEEEEEEGRLIIDEEEKPVRNREREDSSSCNASENEIDFSPVNLSTKENTAGFTNCGHHLVISSVMSLQWSERCNICEIQLPSGHSLELHKKGHCSFPGCLDFIEDDSEREKHLQVHKAHPIKPFRCEFCKKRFHYYRFTKKHREVCKVLKRSKCPHCQYSSTRMGQFNKHLAKHANALSTGNTT